jgi:hypothetical protein
MIIMSEPRVLDFYFKDIFVLGCVSSKNDSMNGKTSFKEHVGKINKLCTTKPFKILGTL